MAFTDPSDLTKAESEELRSHFPAYEQTPTGDKEAFRLDRARHILTARNLSEENSYAFAGIYKVLVCYAVMMRWTDINCQNRK